MEKWKKNKKNKKTWKISYVLAYVTAISEHNVKSSRCYISRPTAIKKKTKTKKKKPRSFVQCTKPLE